MTTFDERGRGFEGAFAHEQTMQFRVMARRNTAIGLWAAAKLGVTGADADTYAKSVVAAGVAKAGDAVIAEKIERDLRAKGAVVSRADIDAAMTRLTGDARLASKT